MESRKQFTFYRSYYQALMQLPKCHRLRLVEAIMAYGLDGREPEGLNGVQSAAFLLIRPTLDAGWKKAKGGVEGANKVNEAKRKSAKHETGACGDRHGIEAGCVRDASGEIEKEKEKEKEREKEKETETETEGNGVAEAGFERFWNLYPVKVGRESAMAAYRDIRPDEEVLCRNLNFWLSSRQWKKENGRFIPRAAKFIRERHFEHVPPDCCPTGGTGYMGRAELEAIERILREECV